MIANGLRAVRARLDLATGHELFTALYKNLRQVEQAEPRNRALLDAFQVVALSMAFFFLRPQRANHGPRFVFRFVPFFWVFFLVFR